MARIIGLLFSGATVKLAGAALAIYVAITAADVLRGGLAGVGAALATLP